MSGVGKLEENIREVEPDYVEGFYNAVGDELAAEDVSVTMLGFAVIELSRAGLEPATHWLKERFRRFHPVKAF